MKSSNKDVDRAGDFLKENPHPEGPEASMLLIVSEWRSAHELPLKRVMMRLKRHLGKYGNEALVSGRTKRIRSIISKLVRQPRMALTQMHDIGGCRVVMDPIENAELLAQQMRCDLGKGLSTGGEIREYNYIETPKVDGYRSIHFVVRYLPTSPSGLNPRRIEIQIRSRLQHRWATALETVDLFTGQTLKIGGGDARWRRFFALASSIFSLQENRSVVPGTPSELSILRKEMLDLASELRVTERLQGWSRFMQFTTYSKYNVERGLYCYLVELDVDAMATRVKSYSPDELVLAHAEYLIAEKRSADNPHLSAVLVTTFSLQEVRDAYPGFYGDTKAFLGSLGLTV